MGRYIAFDCRREWTVAAFIWFRANMLKHVTFERDNVIGTVVALITNVFTLVGIGSRHVSAKFAMLNQLIEIRGHKVLAM